MASDIIDFYKKALEKKKDVVEPQKEIVEEKVETTPTTSTDDPFGGFLFKLTEKINETKIKTIVKEEVKEEALSTKPIQEAVIETVDKNEAKDEDPFGGLLKSIAETIEKGKQKKRQKLKNNTIDFINKLTEKPIEEEIKKEPEKEKEQEQAEELQNDRDDIEEQETTPAPEANNTYVKLLQTSDSKTESKIVSKIDKFSNVKNVIAEEVRKEVAKIKIEMSRLMGESGGGSVATQYAKGGTMDGDLNVTGKFLSGGVDLASLIGTGVVGGEGNKLVSGSQSVTLNSDGTIDFPNNTITPKDDNILTVESSNDTLNAFSRITLTPYGLFAYDENSNSITIDSTDNDIILTTIDTHEWKFNDSGVLVGPGANGVLAVSGLNSYGVILSGGRNILEIIPEGKSAYEIWRDNGNLGSEQEFLDSLIGPVGIEGPEGIQGEQGESGIDGQSAYEIWLNNGNSGSTEQEFLDSLVGPAGEQGIVGPKGENSYQVWLSAGNYGTVSAYLSSLKGVQGDIGETGQSAYEIWSETNSGSEEEFLNSLVGPKGDTGDTVTNTDNLTEGLVNLFYRSDRVSADSPVKNVAGRTGEIVLGISDITNLQTTLDSKQVAGNYVELVNNLIPTIHLPGSVDEIQEYTTFDSLTSTGTELESVLYITLNNNKVYRWGGSTYVEIVGSPGTTDSLLEGSLNKYFTIQRAASAAPVQSVANKTGNVLLEIQDIQNLQPSLTSTNTTTTPITAKLSSSLGAYSNNTVIPANTPFEIILKNLLTTVIPAVYTQPTLSVSISPTTLSYEIGTNISPTLTPNFNKGSAGDATQFRIKSGASILSSTSTSTPFLTSFQLNANTTFTTEVDYGTGPQLYDNIGNPSGTPIQSNTKTATTTFTTFRNNYYTSDTTTTAASNSTQVRSFENSTTSRSFNINIQAGDKRVSFAFPTSLSNINVQIVQVGFGNITSAFTNTTVSVAGANNSNSTNYRVYTYLVPVGYPQAETYSVSF